MTLPLLDTDPVCTSSWCARNAHPEGGRKAFAIVYFDCCNAPDLWCKERWEDQNSGFFGFSGNRYRHTSQGGCGEHGWGRTGKLISEIRREHDEVRNR